ncbi:MAG: 16S rRNA (cytosine(1402)-N(4))-methyltransferase RsmH [Pseudomonadota bacterium]
MTDEQNAATTSPDHTPVMLADVQNVLGDISGCQVIDATFGAGGYSGAFLDAGARVIAFDRDPDALPRMNEMKARSGDQFEFHHAPFSQMADFVPSQSIDAIVFDVGVSSMQFDQAERGFSFRFDGPLDMRMAQAGPSAADLINTLPRADLTRIIGILGGEKQASRISAEIVERRAKQPFATTSQLVAAVEAVVKRRHDDKIHPATKTFQALRVLVNDELRELARALFAAEKLLKPGGILAVVSFHSLEDKIVKQFLAARSGGTGVSRYAPQGAANAPIFNIPKFKVIAVSDEEARENPRARSAKLRMGIRTSAEAGAVDFTIFKFARLPWIDASGVQS